MAVGVFDSGLGGLTILEKVVAALPEVPFVYFADHAHNPYGVREPEDIYRLTCAAAQAMFDQAQQLESRIE